MTQENKQITLIDLSIGAEFRYRGMKDIQRITDIGTRTAAYITLDKGEDTSWYNGPPYAVQEKVLDENDLEAIGEIFINNEWIVVDAPFTVPESFEINR